MKIGNLEMLLLSHRCLIHKYIGGYRAGRISYLCCSRAPSSPSWIAGRASTGPGDAHSPCGSLSMDARGCFPEAGQVTLFYEPSSGPPTHSESELEYPTGPSPATLCPSVPLLYEQHPASWLTLQRLERCGPLQHLSALPHEDLLSWGPWACSFTCRSPPQCHLFNAPQRPVYQLRLTIPVPGDPLTVLAAQPSAHLTRAFT